MTLLIGCGSNVG